MVYYYVIDSSVRPMHRGAKRVIFRFWVHDPSNV